MPSVLDTGKDGYDPVKEFEHRTAKALSAGGDGLFHLDAVELERFLPDFLKIAPVLARLRGYRILDLGCGYGRLSPFLSAFDCVEYLGVDRVGRRIEYATARYGGRVTGFLAADALCFRPRGKFDVVFTSNVLQHLRRPGKLRLVETCKSCLKDGGCAILREEEIVRGSERELESRYASPGHAWHMIPISFGELAQAFRPLRLGHVAGLLYIAR